MSIRTMGSLMTTALLACCARTGLDEIRHLPEQCGTTSAEAKTLTRHDAVGSGTPDDPYLLCTSAQLLDLMSATSATSWQQSYRLDADIDLAGFDQVSTPAVHPIGTASVPFSGQFHGDGHTISHLVFSDTTVDYVGLFGYVSGQTAVIEDLALTAVELTGRQWVGALIGLIEGGATVHHCSSSGVVAAELGAGGLVGSMGGTWSAPTEAASLYACSSSARVQVDLAGVGGLVGFVNGGSQVHDAYATGDVMGALTVGGLIGGLDGGELRTAYATGDVTAQDNIGGLVGAFGGTTIAHCFALGGVTATPLSGSTYAGALIGESWAEEGAVVNAYSLASATCTVSTSPCHAAVSGETVAPTRESFYSPTNEPLLHWNFASTWRANDAALPTLAPAAK